MKSKNTIIALAFGLGLFSQSLALAQGGPANGRGPNGGAGAGQQAPTECPRLLDGACQGGAGFWGAPGECPLAADGTGAGCPALGDGVCPNGTQRGTGVCQSPDGQPKLDGTGGPGKPAAPAGPQDGSGAGRGRGYRGGRG